MTPHRLLVQMASGFTAALTGLLDAARADDDTAGPQGPKLARLAEAAPLPSLARLLDERLFSHATSFWVTALHAAGGAARAAAPGDVARPLRRLRAVLGALCEAVGAVPSGPTLLDAPADAAWVAARLQERGFFAMVDWLHDAYDADYRAFAALRGCAGLRDEARCPPSKRARPCVSVR